MKRVLLLVVVLGAAVAVRADSIKIVLDSSADSGQSEFLGSTVAIAPHAALHAALLPGSSWASSDITADNSTTPANFALPQWHGRDLHQKLLHSERGRHSAHGQWLNDHHDIDYVVQVQAVEPVPEPATILMLGTGLCGLIGAARRKLQR